MQPRTVLLISKMEKSLRVIQVYNYLRSLPFYHYHLLSFYYLHIYLFYDRSRDYTSRTWGNEFTTKPSACWTSLFLSLFTMQPVLGQLKSDVWDPMTKEKITVSQAAETTAPIMKEYMSKHTYKHDLKMMLKVRGEELPKDLKDLSLFTLVPSFTLTQIQKGLLTGMFIYLAFVFIDLIISTLLMYLGMMMVPPMILSLPFKILVFVYLGGYTKIVDIMFKTVA